MMKKYLAMALAGVMLAACGKKDATTTDTTTPASVTPVAQTLDVGDIDMGRHIAADKSISDKTDDFAAKDTIYASIHTKGGPATSQVMARWTFEDGTVVHEETQAVTNAEGNTEFHIAKPSGWPKGKYTVHIMVDGKEVRTKDVTVK